MKNFTLKYLAEIAFLTVTVVLACMLGCDSTLIEVNYDYSFIVFFSCFFAFMLPAYYLATKRF